MVVVFVLVFLFFFLVFHGRGGVEIGFPIVLDGGRELVEAGEERRDLPHVLLGKSLVPTGHAGIADAGADGVEETPLRIVGGIGDETGSGRIERMREGSGFAVEASVAEGAVHGVELHAVFEILISGREWVGGARRMPFGGSIDGTHGDVGFKVRRLDVGGSGEKPEHSEAECAEDEDEKRDDDAEKELAHRPSEKTLCQMVDDGARVDRGMQRKTVELRSTGSRGRLSLRGKFLRFISRLHWHADECVCYAC